MVNTYVIGKALTILEESTTQILDSQSLILLSYSKWSASWDVILESNPDSCFEDLYSSYGNQMHGI